MSTKENQTNTRDEEIDLGRLFELIGRGFTKLFNAIGDLLNYLLKSLIFILLFLRKHFVKFAIAALIGFVGGYFSEGTERTFQSNMVVSSNFNSIYQLYNNITNYNNLVMQKDTLGLVKLFNIDKEEATSLKSFEINPIITENEKLSLLDKFIKTADTTSVKLINANVYLNSLTKYNFKNHKITVNATKNDIFKKLEPAIISNLSKNHYFKNQKKTFDNNIAFEKRELTSQLTQIDSLRNLYKQVLLKEAEKKTPATQIDLSSKSNNKANELELFKIQKEINTRLEEINTIKAEEGEIINKVSGFSSIGTKLSIIRRAPGLYALYLMGLTLIIILLFELNKYLKNYQRAEK